MRISCTKHEKSILITAIRDFTDCSFANREEMCDQGFDCDKCVEQSIEWDVKDDGRG